MNEKKAREYLSKYDKETIFPTKEECDIYIFKNSKGDDEK